MKADTHQLRERSSEPERLYPDEKLMRREPRVRDRREKEKIRRGTKDRKKTVAAEQPLGEAPPHNRIICGDSEQMLRAFPSNSIDIILTSPPYNFGLDYDTGTVPDAHHWDDYFARLNAVWQECRRVLKPGGRLIVNVQPLFSDYIPTHHVISRQLIDLGLLWKGEILWEKNHYNCKFTAWGSWKSPSMPYLKYTWEFIEIFCKDTHKKAGSRERIDITGEEYKKWVYAKWSIAPERNMKEYHHPAMFPEELVERLLKLFSYRDDLILDPFNGAGTTTAVAQRLGRRFIGIDISAEFCRVAEERLRKTPMGLFAEK